MCKTGFVLQSAWRACCEPIPAQQLTADRLPEPIQAVLQRERERIEYQRAKDAYKAHVTSCPECGGSGNGRLTKL